MTKSLNIVLLLALSCAMAVPLVAQQRVAFRGLPWGAPPGPADPLEPWSLSPQSTVPGFSPGAAAGAGVAIIPPSLPAADPGLETAPDVSGFLDADSSAVDATSVVVLQQILIENPHHARQLRDLFDAGVDWRSARQLLKLVNVQEYFREYAVEDLAAGMAAEVAALPDSSWSSGHPWRGRTMFYQVLARAQRSRASLPALGEGLDQSERARLAQLHPKLRQPVVTTTGEQAPGEDQLVTAVLERQEPATFPADATMDGEVKLLVFLGRQGDVTRITVEETTSTIFTEAELFEKAAIEAAQRSVYRPATRNGIPEPSTVRITYPFRVPGQPAVNPANQP